MTHTCFCMSNCPEVRCWTNIYKIISTNNLIQSWLLLLLNIACVVESKLKVFFRVVCLHEAQHEKQVNLDLLYSLFHVSQCFPLWSLLYFILCFISCNVAALFVLSVSSRDSTLCPLIHQATTTLSTSTVPAGHCVTECPSLENTAENSKKRKRIILPPGMDNSFHKHVSIIDSM